VNISDKNTPFIQKFNRFIHQFIQLHQIITVIDLGCGEWISSYKACEYLQNIEYIGYDAYKQTIDNHIQTYPQYEFVHIDFIEDRHIIEQGDLCIIKDVFQYITNKDIQTILDYLIESKKCKYIIMCNTFNQNWENEDCSNHQYGRGLITHMFPLRKYKYTHLFYFNTKQVSLLQIY